MTHSAARDLNSTWQGKFNGPTFDGERATQVYQEEKLTMGGTAHRALN